MSELDATASQWRKAYDERTRGEALGALFRAAVARVRQDVGSKKALEGAARALLLVGRSCPDEPARSYALARALRATLAEHRTVWTLETLAALAACYPPAFAETLAVARDRPATPKTPAARLLARASVDALAKLVAVASPEQREGLFSETLAAAAAIQYAEFDLPSLLAEAAPGIGPVAPDVVLATIAASHPYYRAHAYARVAKDLPPEARRTALTAALADPDDPSLGDARPFIALASCLDAEHYPRALELAGRLYPSPRFGATAMRALLPGWAQLGHLDDALQKARAIPVPVERAIALGNIAASVTDDRARDELVLEAVTLLDEQDGDGTGIGLLAERLVPLGYGTLLVDSRRGEHPEALFSLVRYSTGEERAALLERVNRRIDAGYLEPFARELDPMRVFVPWFAVLEGASRKGDEFFEDECGGGLVEWMAAVPILGGAGGVRQITDAVVAE